MAWSAMILPTIFLKEVMKVNSSPYIEVRNISKSFGNIVANDCINLKLRRGELHALVGENGAGKTTLMRIIMGVYRPDSGDILVDGKKVRPSHPKDVINKGVMIVSQHSSLVDCFNAVENLLITQEFSGSFIPSFLKAEQTLMKWEKELEYKLDLKSPIDFLPYTDRQRIEVVRALCNNLKLLILDEPTSMLPPQYANVLYNHLRRLLKEGIGVFYTTHKISEVMDFSSSITVLRQGKLIFTTPTAKVTSAKIIEGMVGEEIDLQLQKTKVDHGETIVEIKNLSCKDDKEKTTLKSFDLNIRRGEVVGIAGTPNSGKLELVEALLGLRRRERGQVSIGGTNIEQLNTKSIIDSEVGYVPEGAKHVALIDNMTVAENSMLTEYNRQPFSNKGLVDFEIMRNRAANCVEEFEIATESIDTPVWCLSGGNAQKLAIAREFLRDKLRLLVLVNPTAGLDIRTTRSVWKKILALRQKGIGILLISEELNELKQLCDSIIILHEGESVGKFPADAISIEKIGQMILGAKLES